MLSWLKCFWGTWPESGFRKGISTQNNKQLKYLFFIVKARVTNIQPAHAQDREPSTGTGCYSAAKQIRTATPFRALPPQSSASTNFAIAALIFFIYIKFEFQSYILF